MIHASRQDAVVRWCEEKADKATAHEDRVKFQWLDVHLRNRQLHTITRDEIQAIGKAKAAESSRATANRYLALLRAVLKRAAGPWQWIEKAPAVTLYPEAKRRVRWLTKEEDQAVERVATASETACALCARDRITAGQRARLAMVCGRSRSSHSVGSWRRSERR